LKDPYHTPKHCVMSDLTRLGQTMNRHVNFFLNSAPRQYQGFR